MEPTSRTDPPERVRDLFISSGWYPARNVAVPAAVPTDHPAFTVLSEFGGLTVTPEQVVGEECATSDLSFQYLEAEDPITRAWADLLGTRLIGVAEVHQRHGRLLIATDGRCFGSSYIHDAFWFQGASFPEAVERAIVGRRSIPLLRPDQPSVKLYGVEYAHGNPGLYRY